jgi:ectoine hydroxylase-related dioxygenase (phytanoyl-CoA dioxygenase family)
MTTFAHDVELDSEYPLSAEQIARFERDGYIKLKHVFSAEVLDFYGKEISRLVRAAKPIDPNAPKSIYGQAFTQVENLWRMSEIARQFVFSRRLARLATELMRTEGVRLYHDSALYKEASGSYTPWHVDQFYWPMATEKSITAWIPLHAVPLENGPLSFSAGSQRIKIGRELEISDESEKKNAEQLKLSNLPIDETPYDLGEVSFHLGFTFHRAGPNRTQRAREVMTVIYMDRDMRLAEPKNRNQAMDRGNWCPGVEVGQIIDSPMNPVLYSR